MRDSLCVILALCAGAFVVVTPAYSQAETYFPGSVGYSWTFETEFTGLPAFTGTEKFVDTPFVDGRKAFAVEPEAGGGTGVAQTLYAFSGTDAFVRYSALPSPFDTLIGVLPSQWYTMFRLVSPATPAWTVFRYDTAMNVNGLPVPVRILITGKVRSSSTEVIVPAGTYQAEHIDITSQVGTYLGPIFIPFVTIVDSFWIAPSTWIIKQAREPVNFTFDTLSFTIPGIRKNLLSSGLEVSVDEVPGVDDGFRLHQNFPNPFNPSTNISFEIPEGTNVKVRIFDILGREVGVLADGPFAPGRYGLTWDASGQPAGIYVCRIETPSFTSTTKLILLR